MTESSADNPTVAPPATPRTLLVAAAVAALEGVLFLVYGVVEAFALSGERLVMGLSTVLVFALLGGMLVLCAWGLSRRATWARGPVLAMQFLLLLTAWSFRGGETTWVWLVLSALCLVTIVALVHPDSREALSDGG